MASRNYRLIIADDHPLYREALSQLIERSADLDLLGAAVDLPGAMALLEKVEPDLLVLDVNMPGMDGFGRVADIRRRFPAVGVTVISGQLTPETVNDGLKLGLSGFFPKSFDPEALLAAIRLVLAGAVYVPHDVRPAEAGAASGGNGGTTPGALTARESDVLGRMAAGETYKEIGRALGIAEITVKLHAQRIAKKLGARNRAAAIAIAVQNGLVAASG